MKKHKLLLVGFCLLAIILFPSFQQEAVDRKRIREAVNAKLKQFKEVETNRCLQKMMDRAGAMADSILMAESRSRSTDTIVRPLVPNRPHRPEVLLPKDSTPLAPLLEEKF